MQIATGSVFDLLLLLDMQHRLNSLRLCVLSNNVCLCACVCVHVHACPPPDWPQVEGRSVPLY